MAWRNWSGLETSTPSRTITPRSVDDVVNAVRDAAAAGRKIKMVGTGHSFTGISAPVDVMLSPTGLTGILEVDRAAMTVTAHAGTQLKHFNASLTSLGLALHNMGDIAEQTLAGAISTGTHGTGGRVAGIAAQIAGVTMVTADGSLATVTEADDPDLLDLVRVGLGALGVLVTITFHVEPLFGLRATETPMAWDEFIASFDELTADHEGVPAHVDAYWFPHTDRIATKRNVRVSLDELTPLPRWRTWLDDDLLQNTVFGALCQATNRFPATIPRVNSFASGLLSARTYADVSHRVFVAERRVVFREMEYAVPRADGLAVLAECRRAIEASGLRISFPVELRVAKAERPALSTAAARDSFYLAFHVHRDVDHRPYFGLLEPILRAAGGRPHWGKVHTLTREDLEPSYPRFGEFIAVRDRLDPGRVFANPYLDRVLGP